GGEQRRSGAPRVEGKGGMRHRSQARRGALRARRYRRGHRGRIEQPHALRRARRHRARAKRPRRHFARHVGAQPSRRGARAARAARAARREHVAPRVAPDSRRQVGVLLLRRPGRAPQRRAAGRGARRAGEAGAVPENPRLLPGGAMKMDLCDLSPSYVRSIAPYQPGKPISELAREMGLDEAGIVKLASNENPRGIGPRTRAAIDAALADIARYPDGNGFELKQALAKRYGVDMGAVVLGNGSNDVLELMALAFLGPGRAAVFSQHCFAVYPLATQARGARSIVVPAKDYGHDLEAMAKAIDDETYLVWVANPNNPTGTFAKREEMEAFLRRVPERVMVVLDEAYNEYLSPELRADSAKWLKRHPN